jgi:heme-degrading monooxygenase HmoA
MAGTGSFRILLRAEIRAGMEDEFERTWLSVGSVIIDHPANQGQWLLKSEEEGVYYIMSDWTDEPSFRAFETSAEHVEHRKKLHPYRSGGSMTTMTVVHALERPRAEALR